MVTPLMFNYFGYDDFGNSLLYLFGGLELVFVSILVAYVSTRVSDRSFIMVGVVVNIMFYVLNIAFVPLYQQGRDVGLPYFGFSVAIDLFSISVMLDVSTSLITKLVSNDVQGVATAVRRFFAK